MKKRLISILVVILILEYINFVRADVIVPNATISPTITPNITITPTPTITPNATISPTITPNITITPTPTITPNITITPTPTITPNITITPTPTITPNIAKTSTLIIKKNIPETSENGRSIKKRNTIPNPTPIVTNASISSPISIPISGFFGDIGQKIIVAVIVGFIGLSFEIVRINYEHKKKNNIDNSKMKDHEVKK